MRRIACFLCLWQALTQLVQHTSAGRHARGRNDNRGKVLVVDRYRWRHGSCLDQPPGVKRIGLRTQSRVEFGTPCSNRLAIDLQGRGTIDIHREVRHPSSPGRGAAREWTLKGVSEMPTVRVVLHNGEIKIYHDAEAYIDTHNLLRVHRSEKSIAEFQAAYYQYWEYLEEAAGEGKIDTAMTW
jgi:hypothetical protein